MPENEFQRAVEKKKAGDKLNELAQEMQFRDGITYTQAFRRVSFLNPELMKQYRGEPTVAGR